MNDDLSPTHVKRDEFLTARQLAAILQVSESTVRRLARKGRIPALRITPRITRFHLQAVYDALSNVSRPRSVRRSTVAADADGESQQLSFKDLL